MGPVVTTIRLIDVLVICTGNLCRSPMAEALLRRRLAERGVDARVRSAGRSAGGLPATGSAVDAMADVGVDLSDHRSRRATPELVAGSDLVLAMAREHVRDVVLLDPAALPRTFTLKELVRRGTAVGPRAADEPLDAWLRRVDAGRGPLDHLGAADTDDVADPIGRRASVYERTAAELSSLIDALVELAFPQPVAAGVPPAAATTP